MLARYADPELGSGATQPRARSSCPLAGRRGRCLRV
jgi:hypothetical protein